MNRSDIEIVKEETEKAYALGQKHGKVMNVFFFVLGLGVGICASYFFYQASQV